MKHAERLLRHAGDADVEPHRRVEGGLLGDEEVLELGVVGVGLVLVDEVAALEAPLGDRVGDAVDHLAQRRLALGGAGGAAEVLLGDDVGGVQRPRGGELHAELLEGDRPVPEVGDPRVAVLPRQLVVGVDPFGGEVAADADAGLLRCECHGVGPSLGVVVVCGRWGEASGGPLDRNLCPPVVVTTRSCGRIASRRPRDHKM